MKKIITFLSLFLCLGNIKAQTQNPLWSLPPNYYDFSIPAIKPLPTQLGGYDGSQALVVHNSIGDINNKLLFYCIDNQIYDNDGYRIADLTLYGTNVTGWSELPIIPDPDDCNRYFILTALYGQSVHDGGYAPYYGVLNMGLPSQYNTGRMGALEEPYAGALQSMGFIMNPDYESVGYHNTGAPLFAATQTRSGTTKSRFVYLYSNGLLFRYKIANGQLTYDYGISLFTDPNIGMTDYGWANNDIGEMELYQKPDGSYRIAFIGETSQGNLLMLVDTDINGNFDVNTVQYFLLPNGHDDSNPGLEFSPSGDIVYFTSNASINGKYVQFVDLTNTGVGVQYLSISNSIDYRLSQIELGTDGKLYFANASGLSTLNNPDNPYAPSFTVGAVPFNYNLTNPYNIGYGPGGSAYDFYALPDQIDGMDYAARFTQNLQCCIDSKSYDVTSNTYGGTATWTTGTGNNPWNNTTGTVYVQDELRFAAGSNITIQNMTFKFAPGARVIIERGSGSVKGAILTMDGTTFTADDRCVADPMWLGVQVWGNPSLAQTGSTVQQGQLVMKNNATIEYAFVGAMASKRAIPAASPWAYTNAFVYNSSYDGGIIQAANSNFHNNVQDVVFLQYATGNNLSGFNNCVFYTDAVMTYMGTPLFPQDHAYMNATDKVDFIGCDFQNLAWQSYPENNRGTGIHALNATFSAVSNCPIFCPTPDRGTFKHLTYGIMASSYNGSKTFTADKEDFTGNLYGIYMNNTDLAAVKSSNFEVYPSNVTTTKTYGIYMTACTGYHVEANYFTRFNDPFAPQLGMTYGIIVDNSGSTHNEIYRNTFKDLKIGVQAQRVNAGLQTSNNSNPQGLQILCNTFVKDITTADIAVSSGRVDHEQGYHGAFYTMAGNLFSHTDPKSDINDLIFAYDFYNNGNTVSNGGSISYVYQSGSTPHEPTTHTNDPVYGVSLDPDVYSSSNTCPSKLISFPIVLNPGTIGGVAQISAFLQHETDSLKSAILQDQTKIDGGNTSTLLNDIATQSPGNLKNELMQSSPYLSDTVLKSYLAVNPPNGHIKEVVVANSPVTAPVYQKIVDMNLPHGIQKQIDKAQTGISARRLLEDEIAYSEGQRIDYIYEHIRLFLFDSLSPNPMDSIALILKENGITDEMRKLLFDSYLDMPDTVQAIDQRQEVIAAGTCSHFASLSSIKLSLLSATSVVDAINSDAQMQSDLTSIANSGDVCCSSKAQCLLAMAHDTLYAAYIEDLAPSNTAIGMYNGNNSNSMNDDKTQSNLSIYPNPSDGGKLVNVALISQDETLQNSRIEVYNLTGQLVQQGAFEGNNNIVSFSSDQLHQGVYLVKLINNGTVVEVKKLLVNK